MPIQLKCTCGRAFKAPEHLAGKRVKCPGCGETFVVHAEQKKQPEHPKVGLWDENIDDELAAVQRSGSSTSAQPLQSPSFSAAEQFKQVPAADSKQEASRVDLQLLEDELRDMKRGSAAMGTHAINARVVDRAISDLAGVNFQSDETISAFETTNAILRRQWALEKIANSEARLPQFVLRYGVLLPILSVLLFVSLVCAGLSPFIPFLPLVLLFIALLPVGIVWEKWLKPLRKAMADYPRVVLYPEGAISRAPFYRYLCAAVALITLLTIVGALAIPLV